jgi:hypothetical protein
VQSVHYRLDDLENGEGRNSVPDHGADDTPPL